MSQRTQQHPLLIEDVLHQIFDYLPSYDDLAACYNVCSLWKRLTPRYINRVRAPVLVGVEVPLTYTQTPQYLLSVESDSGGNPALKSSRFVFAEANPDTTVMQRLLDDHRLCIKQLELCYWCDRGSCGLPRLTGTQIERLLTHSTPNLETLILTWLPTSLLQADLFQEFGSGSDLLPSLRNVEFQVGFLGEEGRIGYSKGFLRGLFGACPNLESVSIQCVSQMNVEGVGHSDDVHSHGYEIVEAMSQTGRLRQLKKLHIHWAAHDLIEWLTAMITEDGHEQKNAMPSLEHLTVNRIQYCCSILGPLLRGSFIYSHEHEAGARLKSLSFPDDRTRNASVGFGYAILPRLEVLRIMKSDQIRHSEPDSNWVDVFDESFQLQYASQFPRLRVLSLAGRLDNYLVDEIFAEGGAPAPSVRRLDAIPLGVDRVLMRRITRLFPCLTCIQTAIPYGCEQLLISVWEGCPNLTELFLTLGTDQEDSAANANVDEASASGRSGNSLDTIFSGIPDPECQHLRSLSSSPSTSASAGERQSFQWWESIPKAKMASVCDLKGLRKLVIQYKLSTDGKEEILESRTDRLSDVCAYSTLTSMSTELRFFQIAAELHNISHDCLTYICNQTGLLAPKLDGSGGSNSNGTQLLPLRLIKPRLGYEALGVSLPDDFFGSESPRSCNSAVPFDDVLNFVKLSALSPSPPAEVNMARTPTPTKADKGSWPSRPRRPWPRLRLRERGKEAISELCAIF